MYPQFAHELELESGMKVDLRDHGTILFQSLELIRHPRLSTSGLSFVRIEEREPALQTAHRQPEVFYLKERSVDPRALTQAAWHAAKNRGVDFSSGDAVTAINLSDGRITGVTTTKTAFLSEKVVNCAGAWSGGIGRHPIPTRPVKGQMLCLAVHPRDLLKHVIRTPKVYLIPRSDGRLLVGATVEEAGFDKRTDPDTIQRLHKAALELVPQLRDAKILEDWAGLRPGTPDALPILGTTPTPGYFAATGHFRDGILLAPITAKIMADVITGAKPDLDITPFSLTRFS
jgi:glycine oxidase